MSPKLLREHKDLFAQLEVLADKVDEGAQELLALMKGFDRVEDRVRRIFDIEREGDEITHELVREINAPFLAPLARKDAYRLVSTFDDVLDAIEAAAELTGLFGIREPVPQMVDLAATLVQATELTAHAMTQLRGMKTSADTLHAYVSRVSVLEDESDRLYRRMTAYLHEGDFDVNDVLRSQDIGKSIEGAMDRLEGFARTIELIVTESG